MSRARRLALELVSAIVALLHIALGVMLTLPLVVIFAIEALARDLAESARTLAELCASRWRSRKRPRP